MNPFKKAQWIKHPEGDRENTYCRFFESFEYCENAAFKICCEGNFAAYLNGVLFCFGQYLGYDDLQFYDEYALDGYLKRGNNELFIITHHPGVDTSTYRNGSSGVIYEVISGDNIIAASSEKTRVSFDPNYISGKDVGKVSPQLGFTFAFDMTKNKTDPLTAELSNRKYSFEKRPVERLSILPRPKLALVSNGGFSDTLKDGRAAFVMYNSELSPENSLKNSLLPSESGLKLEGKDDGSYIIADLGEENTGILSLDIELSEESRIIIGWGEHLTDGRVRSFIGGRNFASEIRLPKGRHDLDFPLLRCGLRYIELHVYSKSALLHYIGIKPTLYPVKNIAPCPISGEIHKKIYDVSIRTLHLCMHEH